MPTDKFPHDSIAKITDPLTEWATVTPSDTVDLPTRPLAIIVGVAGDVAMISATGADVIMKLPAGLIPVRPMRIKAAGTTATNIVALW
jgi:hypothetical protein